ncbi:unnamed protein product [Dibothriocephalus latus]|uniref:Uncharacterized protein n=1 Tax=Dibothriocephalus latus TaxID=60516 RepID=A0A3P7LBN2_DIBLA|nr:unnamed protein product [Dibothriocephalus latus]
MDGSVRVPPSGSGKRVDQVRPRRRRSGFEPTLESIKEVEEEEDKTENESAFEGTEGGENEDEKREEEKQKNDDKKEEDNQAEGVHAYELENCRQLEKERSKKRWNDEEVDQSVVLTTITIQNNAFEPVNVGPAWGREIATEHGHSKNRRRHRFRRSRQRL